MRLPAEPTKAKPKGGHTCHKTCRVPDFPQRDQRPLPQHILAEKITWSTALWALVKKRGNLGHPVISEEPVA